MSQMCVCVGVGGVEYVAKCKNATSNVTKCHKCEIYRVTNVKYLRLQILKENKSQM